MTGCGVGAVDVRVYIRLVNANTISSLISKCILSRALLVARDHRASHEITHVVNTLSSPVTCTQYTKPHEKGKVSVISSTHQARSDIHSMPLLSTRADIQPRNAGVMIPDLRGAANIDTCIDVDVLELGALRRELLTKTWSSSVSSDASEIQESPWLRVTPYSGFSGPSGIALLLSASRHQFSNHRRCFSDHSGFSQVSSLKLVTRPIGDSYKLTLGKK